ncbi:DUF461 domain-containing protein [Streptomyces sp. AV19]|uniref:DUF461 domain-containing protein n=1 Tax=Streptomyces sp. AV19 TaxID=2793068 RepID=UPI0018FEEB82|nr:DUF461 domain-containing protein [Streptomyces sp. AV19]MBH1936124.1 DUF461 domain-containing protein [Streptomyces sp. AV19]MDG4534080.1 DUF461 domain-containing protein [Streptomyces sp. AV19]
MSSSLRRGALAATVLALSIATLSACGAGNDAQTLEVKPDNAAVAVGDIKLQNINVITQPELDAKGPAVITGQLFNNGDKDQTLNAVKLPGKNVAVRLSSPKGSGPVVVPAGGSLTLGGKGNASAVLPDGRESIKDGEQQQLSFTFSKTGDVRIGAFVVPATSYFKEWGPSEAPSAPAKNGQQGKPGSSASTPASTLSTGKAEEKKGEKDAGEKDAKKNEKNRQATATPDAGR